MKFILLGCSENTDFSINCLNYALTFYFNSIYIKTIHITID